MYNINKIADNVTKAMMDAKSKNATGLKYIITYNINQIDHTGCYESDDRCKSNECNRLINTHIAYNINSLC